MNLEGETVMKHEHDAHRVAGPRGSPEPKVRRLEFEGSSESSSAKNYRLLADGNIEPAMFGSLLETRCVYPASPSLQRENVKTPEFQHFGLPSPLPGS
jgi:hypothetical protein